MIALKTILIIEDDRAINNLIKGTLSAEGYVCDCAFDGREGANLLEEKRYDLVLLDLMLPEIGGYELLEYIHPMGIPAIVISAMGRVEDRIRGLRMGADDYLCKPFQIGELLYFFELSCGVSAYRLGVNPFNQPGVEAYKKNMYKLLGKPGF